MTDADTLRDSIVISLEGTVESATGELEAQSEQTARTIFTMLQDANMLLSASRKPDPFKRLSVCFDDHIYVATISNNKIYVVKKPAL